MTRRGLPVVVLAAATLGLSGCALLLVGAGVAGGYAISKDSVRNLFDLPKDRVYHESLTVLKQMGTVELEDRVHGRLKAEVEDVNVTVTIKQVTKKTVELQVRARSEFLMPKVDVAQEVYGKIVERL